MTLVWNNAIIKLNNQEREEEMTTPKIDQSEWNPVDPDRLIVCLEYSLKSGINPCIWGLQGVGKTYIVRNFIKEIERITGMPGWMIHVPPGIDGIDLHGMPIPDLKNEVVKWLLASLWKEANEMSGKGYFIIFFLDEMNTGNQGLLNALMGFINERRVGDYVRPENSWCIAACNPQQAARAAVSRFSGPMTSRLGHFDLIASADATYHWLVNNGHDIRPATYVKMNPDSVHKFDPRKTERGHPNPRAWEKVSDILKTQPPKEIEFPMIACEIGVSEAQKFVTFLSILKNAIPLKEIKEDPLNARLPDVSTSNGLSCAFFTMSAIASQSTDKQSLNIFSRYASRLPGEFSALYVKIVSDTYKIKKQNLESNEFTKLVVKLEN